MQSISWYRHLWHSMSKYMSGVPIMHLIWTYGPMGQQWIVSWIPSFAILHFFWLVRTVELLPTLCGNSICRALQILAKQCSPLRTTACFLSYTRCPVDNKAIKATRRRPLLLLGNTCCCVCVQCTTTCLKSYARCRADNRVSPDFSENVLVRVNSARQRDKTKRREGQSDEWNR